MFNRDCRPNLLATIAAQKAQSIQPSVTEARTNLCTVSLQRKKHAPLVPMSTGLTVGLNKSRRMRPRTPLRRCTLKNCYLAFYDSKHRLVIHSITQRLCQRRFNNLMLFWFTRVAMLNRYDTRCYFNVRSKADISRLNLPHGNDN